MFSRLFIRNRGKRTSCSGNASPERQDDRVSQGCGQNVVQVETTARKDRKLEILDQGWGHERSLQERRAVDAVGNALPWYTYAAIEFIRQLNFREKTVFEWGAGSSTLFWSDRCRSIVSIEANPDWYEQVRRLELENLDLHLISSAGAEYEDAILSYECYDVIIIDGERRLQCAKNAVQRLCEGGIIILDNSDWYTKAAEWLRAYGLVQIDFSGFGPVNNYTWSTSLYFKGSFGFVPLHDRLPMHGVGALKQFAAEQN